MPETYREPLVLYYRQHKSVENVAATLELNEDAVRKRLIRGREMLQERVLEIVEGTLARTNPGPAFTSNVMAALPRPRRRWARQPTLAATTTAKGMLVATKATGVGVLNTLLGPFIGILSGLPRVGVGLKAAFGTRNK